MNRLVLIRFGILLALSLVGQPALAQAMQDYQYQPNRIYEIRTGLGITTQIELDPNDEVKDYSTGFSSGWELNRRDNVFYLKPKNVDVDTNMMVRTAKRAYIFELKVVATDWQALDQAKRAGVQYKVNFVYPKDEAFPEATGQAADYPGPLHLRRDARPDPVPDRQLPGRVRTREAAGGGLRREHHGGEEHDRRARNVQLSRDPPR